MNIHLPAILMFTRGTRLLTYPHIVSYDSYDWELEHVSEREASSFELGVRISASFRTNYGEFPEDHWQFPAKMLAVSRFCWWQSLMKFSWGVRKGLGEARFAQLIMELEELKDQMRSIGDGKSPCCGIIWGGYLVSTIDNSNWNMGYYRVAMGYYRSYRFSRWSMGDS